MFVMDEPKTDVASLEARYKKADTLKTEIDPYVRDAYRYLAPSRLTQDGDKVNPTGANDTFDSTPMKAYMDYASTIHSVIAPPGKKFIELAPGPVFAEGNERNKLSQSLEKITEILFSYLAVSNFDTVMGECAGDYGIGTACMAVHKGVKGNPFVFQAIDYDDYLIENGPYGNVGGVFRQARPKGRDVMSTWPDADLSQQLKHLIEEKPDDNYTFRECQIPSKVTLKRTNPESKKVEKYETSGFKYIVYYVGENNERAIIVEREMETAPFIVFRNNPRGKNPWGFGPALVALPDAKTLNAATEMTLKNASFALSGVYTYTDDGVLNVDNINIQPLTFIPVASNGSQFTGPTIAELPRTGNFDLGQVVQGDLRKQILEILETNPMGPLDASVRSATEMSYRQQNFAQKSGSAFGRLNHEFLTALVRRLLNILEEFGIIDLQNFRVDGVNVQVQHISPIARAQDQEELTSVILMGEIVREMYGPEALHVVMPMERTVPLLGDLTGAKTSSYLSGEEIKAAKAQAANAAQQPGVVDEQ
ncbi:MAG: hypothetical protein CMF62_06420 [Magnetococcales bacterium]|nr:hypothetical protein [Magnetococcales bacterium]